MTPDRCKSCKASILWATTVTGNAMPLDAAPLSVFVVEKDADGDEICAPLRAYQSHFATCPFAKSWRGKKR